MGKHENLTGAQRVAKRRAALRAQGLRPKQFWVPDLRDPRVRAEIQREGAEINRRDENTDVMAWLESLQAELWADEPDYDWGSNGPPEDIRGEE
jgi:hypothetical protein